MYAWWIHTREEITSFINFIKKSSLKEILIIEFVRW